MRRRPRTRRVSDPARLRRGARAAGAVTEPLDGAAPRSRTDHDLLRRVGRRARAGTCTCCSPRPRTGFVPYAGIPWYVAPFGRDAHHHRAPGPAVRAGHRRRHAALPRPSRRPRRRRLHRPGAGQDPARAAARRDGGVPRDPVHSLLRQRGRPAAVRHAAGRVSPLDGGPALARELWPTAERALALDASRRPTPRAAISPTCAARRAGLTNQGWKDSLDAIMHADGGWPSRRSRWPRCRATLRGAAGGGRARRGAGAARARPPNSAARPRACASGSRPTSGCPTRRYYALALDREGAPCRVITSNAGPPAVDAASPSDSRAHIVARPRSWPTTCSPAGASARWPAASGSTTR